MLSLSTLYSIWHLVIACKSVTFPIIFINWVICRPIKPLTRNLYSWIYLQWFHIKAYVRRSIYEDIPLLLWTSKKKIPPLTPHSPSNQTIKEQFNHHLLQICHANKTCSRIPIWIDEILANRVLFFRMNQNYIVGYIMWSNMIANGKIVVLSQQATDGVVL